jgi:hypothetical protein
MVEPLGWGVGAFGGACERREVSALEVGWRGGKSREDDTAVVLANLDLFKLGVFHPALSSGSAWACGA